MWCFKTRTTECDGCGACMVTTCNECANYETEEITGNGFCNLKRKPTGADAEACDYYEEA